MSHFGVDDLDLNHFSGFLLKEGKLFFSKAIFEDMSSPPEIMLCGNKL